METRVLTATPGAEGAVDEIVDTVAEVLNRGGIAALPTETVYGLAVRGDDLAALGRLRDVKGRDGQKPLAFAFADRETALSQAIGLSRAAQRLAERFWPGPLTLVVRNRQRGTTGLRVPGDALTRAIIARSGGMLALTSANPSGGEPARSADEVRAHFDGRIDVIVDGGPSPLGQPSCVVRAISDQLEILREGILTERDLNRAAQFGVLFVCSGNTCRSPMAAALLRNALARRLETTTEELPSQGFRIDSAGLYASPDSPASAGAQHAMELRSIGLGQHRSKILTRELLDQQDLVLVMTHALLGDLRRIAGAPERVRHIDPAGTDVADPFGGSNQEYERSAAQIERLVERLADELTRGRPADGGA